MNPLNNHRHSLILGIVLAVVVAALIGGSHLNMLALARWFHITAGVFWIGLLYYFNVAQTPALADAAADKGGPGGAGITKYVAPRALFWFRWGAVATWLGGIWLLGPKTAGAFSLGIGMDDPTHYFRVIGIGAWLGTIMFLNVWGIIWPNQKKIIRGTLAGTPPANAAVLARQAFLASRTNFFLSVPLLFFMATSYHYVIFGR